MQQLSGTESGGSYHPKFSPSGDYLLLTADNYAGLKRYDLSNGNISVITKAPNAGYNVQVSSDGQNIFYRESSQDKRNMRHIALKTVNLSDNKTEQIVAPTRVLPAHRVVDGTVVYVKGNKAARKRISGEKLQQAPDMVTIEDRQMILYRGNSRLVVAPNGTDASYIWPSISPDGAKLVYTVAGRGTFVCNIDGTQAVSLGKIHAPVWLGNKWVVGMNDKDDGERIISSVIEAVSIDGKIHKVLSDPSQIAMYPAVSADNSSIAFNTEKGTIYLMKIVIK